MTDQPEKTAPRGPQTILSRPLRSMSASQRMEAAEEHAKAIEKLREIAPETEEIPTTTVIPTTAIADQPEASAPREDSGEE